MNIFFSDDKILFQRGTEGGNGRNCTIVAVAVGGCEGLF